MRPGRGFGVILDAGERIVLVSQPLDGLVVQIYVRDSDIAFKRIGVHGKAVILRLSLIHI